MREIKFRAWDQDQKRFGYIDLSSSDFGDPSWFDCPLQQYTGLKDKNGVEIYEGDIVRAKGTKQGVYEVKSVSFGLGCEPFNDDYFLGEEDTEVIGNIYENPELIK